MKASLAAEAKTLTDLPNIGPAIKGSLQMVGISRPTDLTDQDPYALYMKLNHSTGLRHDPCVLDVFMAAVDFMNGASAKPWWHYTQTRKKRYPNI